MKVVTFGEIMLRLEPEGYFRFVQVDKMTSTFGGGEANVAVSLANYGLDAYYVTKLPKHEIGQAAINSLRRFGVNTNYIARGGDRVGIYYNERGASQRGSKCIYDRAHSSIAEAKPEDFDWAEIFKDCKWFHLTGITPALGGNLVQICIEACKAAKAAGATVSCDLNYRGKLWTREQAREAMTKICKYVDVCISNEEDAKDVFGIEAENTDHSVDKIHIQEINMIIQINRLSGTGPDRFWKRPEHFTIRIMDQTKRIALDRTASPESLFGFIQIPIFFADPVIPFGCTFRYRFNIGDPMRIYCFHVSFVSSASGFISAASPALETMIPDTFFCI